MMELTEPEISMGGSQNLATGWLPVTLVFRARGSTAVEAGGNPIQPLPFVENTPAILLRTTRFSDTSLIVEWFTEMHGKLKTVAKGARRPKSGFAGKLDLFFDAEISFIRSRRSDLHTLREVALREVHGGLRTDLERVALASYFVELIELVTELEHPAPDIYGLLQRAFAHLAANPASARALLHFERELVRFLGIHGQPDITPVVAIGRAYGRIPSARASLIARLQS